MQVKVKLTTVKSRIKESAETSEEPRQHIISNELANVSEATMTNFPRRENLRRTIRHQRNGRHKPPNPEMRPEIPVKPLECQLSENEEQFLLFESGHGDDDRILIFANWKSGTVIGLSAFAHRYFSNCIPFMLKITVKEFSVFLYFCLEKQGLHTTDSFRRYKTTLLAMNHIPLLVTLSLLQLIQLQQTSQMRILVVASFICVPTSGKRFNHLACRYSIIMITSLLLIYE